MESQFVQHYQVAVNQSIKHEMHWLAKNSIAQISRYFSEANISQLTPTKQKLVNWYNLHIQFANFCFFAVPLHMCGNVSL